MGIGNGNGVGVRWIDYGMGVGSGAFTLSLFPSLSLLFSFPQSFVDATKDHKPKRSKWQLPNLIHSFHHYVFSEIESEARVPNSISELYVKRLQKYGIYMASIFSFKLVFITFCGLEQIIF
jgi:hypothetical protein